MVETAALRPKVPERFKRLAHRPLILGHRGARHAAEENTLAAFELARQEGADGVELDVVSSKDGVPFVLHDLDLRMVTDGRDGRPVASVLSDELAMVAVRGGAPLPRLSEVLDWASKYSMLLNIELKTRHARTDVIAGAVAELLRDQPESYPHVLISSFNPVLLRRFQDALPEVATAFLFSAHHARWAELARPLGVCAVHPDARCFLLAGAYPRPPGMLVNTWTVNEVDSAKVLANRGVDAIITDHPGRLLAALGRLDSTLGTNEEASSDEAEESDAEETEETEETDPDESDADDTGVEETVDTDETDDDDTDDDDSDVEETVDTDESDDADSDAADSDDADTDADDPDDSDVDDTDADDSDAEETVDTDDSDFDDSDSDAEPGYSKSGVMP